MTLPLIPFEYFCHKCGQLRLCLNPDRTTCENCESLISDTGKPGSLDDKKLKDQWRKDNTLSQL